MTQTGKCDTCRLRKVKCDEKKPKCGACRKKDRPCTYTYGRPTALVREHPTHFSRHGRSKVAPLVYPLITSYAGQEDVPAPESSLRLTMQKEAETGEGIFQTFALSPEETKSGAGNEQDKALERIDAAQGRNILWRRRRSPQTLPLQLSCPLETLAARFVGSFALQVWDINPFDLHGSWIAAIPSRLGSSTALDLAVEFAVNGLAMHHDASYSNEKAALVSRSKAIKSLRLALGEAQTVPSYDVLLATKMHSYAEIFVSLGTLAYATHCLGLSSLLKQGSATGLDEEYYWSLVDNTYMDEAIAALLYGRYSSYDTELYRELTSSPPPDKDSLLNPEYTSAPGFLREAKAIMHVFIQIPRLAYHIRQATRDPEDTGALISAISLAEELWNLDPAALFDNVLSSSTRYLLIPPSPDLNDLISHTIHFDSIATILICFRYWNQRIFLVALIETLLVRFPNQCALSCLPDLDTAVQADIGAATLVAQSLYHVLFLSPSHSLVPLRALGPLSLSIGSWLRLARRCGRILESLDPSSAEYLTIEQELQKAKRMQSWAIEQGNHVHDAWGVAGADEEAFEIMADAMAGGELVPWIADLKDWEEGRSDTMTSTTEWGKKFAKQYPQLSGERVAAWDLRRCLNKAK